VTIIRAKSFVEIADAERKRAKPLMKDKLIAFDMDGTLIDSSKAIGRFIIRLHVKLDLKAPSNEELRKIHGESASEVIASVLAKKSDPTKRMIRQLVEWTNRVYPRYYMEKYAERVPGAADTIKRLSNVGYIVIISSNVGNAVRKFISWEGIKGYVGPPSYQSEYESKRERLISAQLKNSVSSSNTVYVGDSVTDMEMGRDVGVRTIGVLRLSSNADQVSRMADQTVMDVTEIPNVLKKGEAKGFFRAA
jgi:phosphoglycolate phosphatase